MKTKPMMAIAFATSVQAVSAATTDQAAIIDCTVGPAEVWNIVEPLSETSRTFANGSIRVMQLDTGGEPACCSSYLALLAPSAPDNFADRQCKLLVSNSSGAGFLSLSVRQIRSSYDPEKGLLLIVPVERYIDGVATNPTQINVRIHQGNGTIIIE